MAKQSLNPLRKKNKQKQMLEKKDEGKKNMLEGRKRKIQKVMEDCKNKNK